MDDTNHWIPAFAGMTAEAGFRPACMVSHGPVVYFHSILCGLSYRKERIALDITLHKNAPPPRPYGVNGRAPDGRPQSWPRATPALKPRRAKGAGGARWRTVGLRAILCSVRSTPLRKPGVGLRRDVGWVKGWQVLSDGAFGCRSCDCHACWQRAGLRRHDHRTVRATGITALSQSEGLPLLSFRRKPAQGAAASGTRCRGIRTGITEALKRADQQQALKRKITNRSSLPVRLPHSRAGVLQGAPGEILCAPAGAPC